MNVNDLMTTNLCNEFNAYLCAAAVIMKNYPFNYSRNLLTTPNKTGFKSIKQNNGRKINKVSGRVYFLNTILVEQLLVGKYLDFDIYIDFLNFVFLLKSRLVLFNSWNKPEIN